MELVRSDNCHRIRNRAARSIVRDLSVQRPFEKLGKHHRGTRARFTDESSLVELVRISAVRRTGLDLDEHQNAEKRRARRSRPTISIWLGRLFRHCLLYWEAGFCGGGRGE